MADDVEHNRLHRVAVGVGTLVASGLLVAALAGLFSGDSTTPTTAGQPTLVTSTSTVPSTTSSVPEVTTTNENRESGDLPGELSLSECAWISPGKYQFEMTWEPQADNEPAAVELILALGAGDVGLSQVVTTVLDEPTTFMRSSTGMRFLWRPTRAGRLATVRVLKGSSEDGVLPPTTKADSSRPGCPSLTHQLSISTTRCTR